MFGLLNKKTYKHPLKQKPSAKVDVRKEMQRRKSHYLQIMDLLKAKGQVTNIELARITYRYSARIGELRKDGHKIVATYIRPGVWLYTYRSKR